MLMKRVHSSKGFGLVVVHGLHYYLTRKLHYFFFFSLSFA